MKFRTVNHILFSCLLIVSLALASAGCARSRSLMMLEEDALDQEEGFQSIVVWSVQVTDRTDSIGSPPVFSVYGPDEPGQAGTEYSRGKPEYVKVQGEWASQDKEARFESIVVAETKPGAYLFKNMRFYLSMERVPNYWTNEVLYRDVYLTVPIGREYAVAPGRLVYLGTVQVEVTREGKYGYSYRVHVTQDNDDREKALKQFQRNHPLLYRRYKDAVDTSPAKLFHIEDFKTDIDAWTVPFKDKYIDAEIVEGEYVVQSKNNECHWSVIRSPFDKVENVDIELTGRRTSGVAGAGYGVIFGSDPENIYGFQVSSGGQAKVELYRNGVYVSDPVGWKDVPSVGSPKKDANRLRVEVRGNTMTYSVNGAPVGDVKSELDMKEFSVGVIVCDKQTAAFDLLSVVER